MLLIANLSREPWVVLARDTQGLPVLCTRRSEPWTRTLCALFDATSVESGRRPVHFVLCSPSGTHSNAQLNRPFQPLEHSTAGTLNRPNEGDARADGPCLRTDARCGSGGGGVRRPTRRDRLSAHRGHVGRGTR